MKILDRYLTKEMYSTFAAVTGILLVIALSNRFVIYLAKAASGALPLALVLKVVALYIPELLAYLMPLGFFMAILFAYGRLHADSEMRVLATSGLSFQSILSLIIKNALILLVLTASLSLWLIPASALYREKTLAIGEAVGMMHAIVPGRFQSLDEGRLVFYVERTSMDHKVLHNVFIAEQPLDSSSLDKWTIITADSAYLEQAKKDKNFNLLLNKGYRYSGIAGGLEYTLVKFAEYGRSILPSIEAVPDLLKIKSSLALLFSTKIEDMAELHWRLAFPITLPILALFGLALSRVDPRQGRFAKFLPAIFIYIIYYNLLILGKRWLSIGRVPSFVGIWWVHLLMLGFAILLLLDESGFWQAYRARRTRSI